jgi:hypothetical protein
VALRDEILSYLEVHPKARDTAEGFKWSLPDCRYSTEELRIALDELATSGEIATRSLPDGSTVYAAKGVL